MDGVVVAVERSIASELPSRFGIMLDGWTNAFEHYIAVFACYEVNGSLKSLVEYGPASQRGQRQPAG
ncbi:hypothetical protein PI125_g10097 [Phytophthora idaei]|nr:hypothetical protein PI125_g10097 [Phytophthora idaei]